MSFKSGARLGVAILLAALFLEEVLSMRLLNASSDEAEHLSAGYSYLKTGDFRLNPQHPPFIKSLAAAPLLFLDPRFNLDDPNWKSDPPRGVPFGVNFLYTNDADRLLFWGRLPIVFLSLLLGLYVCKWASELFGPSAGLTALFLYSFCPNIIAHSRVVTMDMGLSCFSLISLYYLWRYVRRGGNGNRLAAATALGLALASKFSAVILLPTFALILATAVFWPSSVQLFLQRQQAQKGSKRKARQNNVFIPIDLRSRITSAASVYLVILFVAGLVVYAAYFFPGDPLFYWKGASLVNKDHNPQYQYYLLGHFKQGRWWYYFLLAFLIKTPVPTLILLCLSLALYKSYHSEHWLDEAFLILPTLIFTALTSALADDIGLRYLLPIYPLIFIFVSRLASFFSRNRLQTALAVFLGVWYLFAGLHVYPDYLAYFNELVGGPERGYKYLDDSNIEWGQDLKRLKAYMDQHGVERIRLLYPWNASPEYYGIKGQTVTPDEWYGKPSPGVYAISTHALIRGQLSAEVQKVNSDWLRRYQPIDRVGYSFYIFKFDKAPGP